VPDSNCYIVPLVRETATTMQELIPAQEDTFGAVFPILGYHNVFPFTGLEDR